MKLLLIAAVVLAIALLFVSRARAAPPATAPAQRSMPEVEAAIREFIRAQGPRPEGEIRAHADEGTLGYRGAVKVGDATRREVDFATPESEAANAGKLPLEELLQELHAASRRSAQGPWTTSSSAPVLTAPSTSSISCSARCWAP